MGSLYIDKFLGKEEIGVVLNENGEPLQCKFRLAEDQTSLTVYYPTVVAGFNDDVSARVLHVKSTNGLHLSFVDVIRTDSQRHLSSGTSSGSYFPHFVVIGKSPIPIDHKVANVAFDISDAPSIFYDFDTFSIAADEDKHIHSIIAEYAESVKRPVQIGPSPVIAFFSGKLEILSATTRVGEISVRNQPSYGMGSPKGVAIENNIKIVVELAQHRSVPEVMSVVRQICRFLQVIAGRQQVVSGIQIKLGGDDDTKWFDLYDSMGDHVLDRSLGEGASPRDMPICGGQEPEAFASVMQRWIDTDEDRQEARAQFGAGAAKLRHYGLDRLVSSANMFDILPSSCFASAQPLSDEVRRARFWARKLFKALPPSDIRDRALGDLGRLESLNLKAKVQQRASKVRQQAGTRLAALELILNNAIDARHHFVHGTKVSRAKSQFYRKWLPAHVDALEFVFASAELLDCGWSYTKWAQVAKAMNHPMSAFERSFDITAQLYIEEWGALASSK